MVVGHSSVADPPVPLALARRWNVRPWAGTAGSRSTASIPAIVLAADGMPASDYFEPYVPEPGTIGAD